MILVIKNCGFFFQKSYRSTTHLYLSKKIKMEIAHDLVLEQKRKFPMPSIYFNNLPMLIKFCAYFREEITLTSLKQTTKPP